MIDYLDTDLPYVTDSGQEVSVTVKYRNDNNFPVSANDRLQDGGFNLADAIGCAFSISRRKLKPRMVIVRTPQGKKVEIIVQNPQRFQEILNSPDSLQTGTAFKYIGETFLICKLN